MSATLRPVAAKSRATPIFTNDVILLLADMIKDTVFHYKHMQWKDEALLVSSTTTCEDTQHKHSREQPNAPINGQLASKLYEK